MIYFIYGSMVSAIALIMWAVSGPSTYVSARKIPEVAEQTRRVKVYSFLGSIFPFSRNILEKFKLDAPLKMRLDAAHSRMTGPEFFNLKLLLIIVLGIIAFVGLKKTEPWVLPTCLILGYIVPDIILNRKIAQRKYMISRLLPETVDLLGLCVEAGLDFTLSVKWILEKTPMNAMLEELTFVLEEIKWGKPRSQALRDMSKRLGIPEVSSFVQTLILAERMGTPVAEAFTIISEDTRLQRFHRGERIAMKAPLKILIPLIFCILPVIAIVVGGPIFLEFMQGDIFKLGGR
jgi:tight adherence protein C